MSKKKKQRLIFYLASKLGWLLIIALGKTLFIKEKKRYYLDRLNKNKEKYIFTLWHGRMFVPIYVMRGKKICPMISLHSDGEMIARTVMKLGYQTVRGSSTRGGKQAFHDLVNKVKQGTVGAMIPDGPTGPVHKLKPGTLFIAQQAGAYLLPMTFSAQKNKVFKSWDKFLLPMPFSKVLVLYGKPIQVPERASSRDLVNIKNDFEQQMNLLERQADGHFRE